MIRAVLWDLDGTLLDFKAAESAAVRRCFAAFGFRECTPEMVARYSAINVRYWEMLERGERTREQILRSRFEEFLSSCGLDARRAEEFNLAYEAALPDTVTFLPGARETVTALRGRVVQCIVTNGSAAVQDPKLRRSGLDRIMDHVFISEQLGAEKPTEAFFARVFAVLPFPREECLIVGDSLTSDMRGGVNAGIRTCWFDPSGAENRTEVVPEYRITDLRQVLEII